MVNSREDNTPPGQAARIWIDADACPVKDEIYRVALRHEVPVVVVSNAPLRIPRHPLVQRVVADGYSDSDQPSASAESKPKAQTAEGHLQARRPDRPQPSGRPRQDAENPPRPAHEGPKYDAADDYIAERADSGSVVITGDILLAERCLKAGAQVIAHNGKPFTIDSIGSAIATRAIMADLRAGMDGVGGGPAPFSKADRSRFLQALDRVLVGLG